MDPVQPHAMVTCCVRNCPGHRVEVVPEFGQGLTLRAAAADAARAAIVKVGHTGDGGAAAADAILALLIEQGEIDPRISARRLA